MNHIRIKKLGIAISTYSEDVTDPYRYKIIEKSLTSLIKTIKSKPEGIDIYAVITIDGAIPDCHLSILQKFSDTIKILQRKENGGVSRVKNTGIKTLLQENVDVGILVDDDVLFHEKWIETYVKFIEDFQLHHLAWNDKRIFEGLKKTTPKSRALKSFSYANRKGYKIIKHPGSCGIFLTFTPALIEKIGYFKLMPGKIGNEHQHFTIRANKAGMIGHPIDLENSYEFIEHIGVLDMDTDLSNQIVVHSVSDEFREKENKNSGLNVVDLDRYFSCIE